MIGHGTGEECTMKWKAIVPDCASASQETARFPHERGILAFDCTDPLSSWQFLIRKKHLSLSFVPVFPPYRFNYTRKAGRTMGNVQPLNPDQHSCQINNSNDEAPRQKQLLQLSKNLIILSRQKNGTT